MAGASWASVGGLSWGQSKNQTLLAFSLTIDAE